ncbi:hypothetical protein [Ascidiaceihabitans sp.]|uniref:hypothetical protein n=1 Tax=Ascidiaceihabitans sp. TaxID=1872644 RepID=UPI00329814E8
MQPVLYSHRLKTVLQHTVRELGLTLVLNDQQSLLPLRENEAVIRESAALLGINVNIEISADSTTVTFFA